MINPLGAIITQARKALLSRARPRPRRARRPARLLIPLGIIAVMFALGLWYFNREAPLISEKL